MSENSNFDGDYDNGSLINVSDPSSFSSQQLLECLNYNRKLQDNLTLRLKSIEEARKQNLNHQKWVTEFASSHGLINDFKNGPNQEERENSQRKARYQVNLPCIITGDNEEDARLKELANFEYLPYFVGNHEEAPLESFEKMQKDKPTPLVKNARRWQLREISILAAAVRQENMRLKIEGLLKRTNGPNSRKGLDTSDKSAGEPPMEVWQVRKLPDRELELNLKGLNWEKIAQNILGRSPKECAIRWTCYDHPLINKADWTDEEELKLAQIAKSYNYRNWQAIASELNTNRTAIQCFHQYQTKMNHGLVRKRWTKEEDNILREAVKVYGERNWQQIAQCLVNRTGQQCLHRWAKALNPAIKRGRWTPEEDEVLKAAVAKYGAHSWVKIQPHVKGRTDVQCRERWMNVLHPGIDDSYWNPYEDAHLLSLVNKIGVGKWSSISQELSNRTDNQCWRRWKRLVNIGVVNGELITDPSILANIKPQNKSKSNSTRKSKKRDEDDSEQSDGDSRYNRSTKGIKITPTNATDMSSNNPKKNITRESSFSSIKDARRPIGGAVSYRKDDLDHTWASIDRKITTDLDLGKPLPPVLGSVALYEKVAKGAGITPQNFTSLVAENEFAKNSEGGFNVESKDLKRLKDVFQSLFTWPHITGSVMVECHKNLKKGTTTIKGSINKENEDDDDNNESDNNENENENENENNNQ